MSAPGWFQRNGTPVPADAKLRPKGRGTEAYVYFPCKRCGDTGRYSYCPAYGDRCFECGGAGKGTYRWTRVYTDAELEKLNATRDARREAKRAKRLAELTARRAAFILAHPTVTEIEQYIGRNEFLASLWDQLKTRGELSDKQLGFIPTAIAGQIERDVQAAKQAAAPHWTPGRQTFEGEVLKTKWQDSDFGGALKMLVKLDDERRCWGTVPDALLKPARVSGKAEDELKVGDRVRITATIEPTDSDLTFAFYKRPRALPAEEVTQ
jgi:hypothetical protein